MVRTLRKDYSKTLINPANKGIKDEWIYIDSY